MPMAAASTDPSLYTAAKERQVLLAVAALSSQAADAGDSLSDKLHDEILRELPDDFVRRMRNWARDRDGGRISTAYLGDRVDYWLPENPIPTMEGEAVDTQRALLKLPQRYQEVIVCFWMFEAKPLSWMARATTRLRLWKLGAASFAQWLKVGHDRLRVEVMTQRTAQAKRAAVLAAAQARQ